MPRAPSLFHRARADLTRRADVPALWVALPSPASVAAWQIVALTSAPIRHMSCWLPAELEPYEIGEAPTLAP